MFSQIKDRKHINQIFFSVAWVKIGGAGRVKNFSVGICDGAPLTARSSLLIAVMPTPVKRYKTSFNVFSKHNIASLRHLYTKKGILANTMLPRLFCSLFLIKTKVFILFWNDSSHNTSIYLMKKKKI